MQNLKITFDLESPVIFSNRFTTIDSILLSVFFPRFKEERNIKSFIKTEDYLDEISKFIEVKNGIISGSVWYKEPCDPVCREDYSMFKSMKHDEYLKYGLFTDKNFDTGSGQFKAFSLTYGTLALPKIYFYITGDKEIISELLKDIKYFGKKKKIGFGFTDSEPIIEEIPENKGILLNKTTVSKPVPCNKLKIDSHRVMFYRGYPPYWEKGGKSACYMPPLYDVETTDTTWSDPDFKSLPDSAYISPSEFAYKYAGHMINGNPIIPEKKHTCIMCGGENGIKRTLSEKKQIFPPNTFNDFPSVGTGDYICDFCRIIENSENLNKTANLFMSDTLIDYIGGGNFDKKIELEYPNTTNMSKKRYYKEYLRSIKQEKKSAFYKNIKTIAPPFLFTIKNTSNSAHIIFMSNVAISNALFQISTQSDDIITIDTEMFNSAVSEMECIMQNKNIKKGSLLSGIGSRQDMNTITRFISKYPKDILTLLNLTVFKKEEE